ncbi:hypothetical protein VD659_03535 [Herbiconiux sp. 11R-BC]|uniref:hypothetical protein n=1 Tax=Herbiconiux sp. 11R-BC TaxID=3111637 RepID=UPI003C0C21C1
MSNPESRTGGLPLTPANPDALNAAADEGTLSRRERRERAARAEAQRLAEAASSARAAEARDAETVAAVTAAIEVVPVAPTSVSAADAAVVTAAAPLSRRELRELEDSRRRREVQLRREELATLEVAEIGTAPLEPQLELELAPVQPEPANAEFLLTPAPVRALSRREVRERAAAEGDSAAVPPRAAAGEHEPVVTVAVAEPKPTSDATGSDPVAEAASAPVAQNAPVEAVAQTAAGAESAAAARLAPAASVPSSRRALRQRAAVGDPAQPEALLPTAEDQPAPTATGVIEAELLETPATGIPVGAVVSAGAEPITVEFTEVAASDAEAAGASREFPPTFVSAAVVADKATDTSTSTSAGTEMGDAAGRALDAPADAELPGLESAPAASVATRRGARSSAVERTGRSATSRTVAVRAPRVPRIRAPKAPRTRGALRRGWAKAGLSGVAMAFVLGIVAVTAIPSTVSASPIDANVVNLSLNANSSAQTQQLVTAGSSSSTVNRDGYAVTSAGQLQAAGYSTAQLLVGRSLAQELVNAMDSGKLVGSVPDHMKEIRWIAQGVTVPDCGVDYRVLEIIAIAVRNFDQVGVSDINRKCTGQIEGAGTSSSHYVDGGGHAVDFYLLDNKSLNGTDAGTLKLISLLDPVMPLGAHVGQAQCRASAGISLKLSNWTEFDDACTHMHVDVPVTDAPLLLTDSSLLAAG